MKVFDIDVKGIDLSTRTISILAKDMPTALKTAAEIHEIAKTEWYEDAEVTDVRFNCEISTAEELQKELSEKRKEIETKEKEE